MSMNYPSSDAVLRGKNDMRPAVGCRTNVCKGTWQLFFTTSHWQRIAGPVEEAALDIAHLPTNTANIHKHCAQKKMRRLAPVFSALIPKAGSSWAFCLTLLTALALSNFVHVAPKN